MVVFGITAIGCTKKTAVNTESAPGTGDTHAQTEIVIFSDFQCPFCKKAAREIQRLMTLYPTKLKVYFKYYPLAYHPYGFKAAQAAEAAKRQGKFWEMHDELFAHTEALNDDLVMELASELQLNMQQFTKDMYANEVIEKIHADKKEGEQLGIGGTPSFFVNGVLFKGSYLDLENEFN